jgi:hypothetical protein
MKAYGTEHQHYFFTSDEPGAPSKHRKLTGKNRRTSRRLLHKEARNQTIRFLRKSLEEI